MTKTEIKEADQMLDVYSDWTETAIEGRGQCITAHWIGGGAMRFSSIESVHEWVQERRRLGCQTNVR